MKKNHAFTLVSGAAFLCLALAFAPAEDGFGFDDATVASDPQGTASTDSSSRGMSVHGSVSAGATQFVSALDDADKLKDIRLGNMFSGRLDLSAKGTNADAAINIDLNEQTLSREAEPFSIFDEAWFRMYFGKLDIETGLRKLTWGKADSQGPLDVLNPLDLTDLTVTDSLARKIARPMVHATYALGTFTKLEGVVIPSFEGHHIATAGPWAPRQITDLPAEIIASVPATPYQATFQAGIATYLNSEDFDMTTLYPDTGTLEYTQAGFRVTTTIGSNDIGFQYFTGNLPRPAISITGFDAMPPDLKIKIAYNRYHQIGVDYAAVLVGFNVRTEIAANITKDLSGDDGEIYNPAMLWSVGFDRDLFAGINANVQFAGSVRLLDGKVGDTLADTESGTDMTQTKITLQLSRKFLKDELELKAAGMYGIEDADYVCMPSVAWNKGDVSMEMGVGLFGGNTKGELGQYDNNDYIKASIKYTF